jgi:hypothetical protein
MDSVLREWAVRSCTPVGALNAAVHFLVEARVLEEHGLRDWLSNSEVIPDHREAVMLELNGDVFCLKLVEGARGVDAYTHTFCNVAD